MKDKISGIYRIVCVKNGRYYFGSSANIKKRWALHKSTFRRGIHHNIHMQRSYDKHGEVSFRLELVKEVEPENLLDIEQQYLNEHVGKSNCFNQMSTSGGGAQSPEICKAHGVKIKQMYADGRMVSWNKGKKTGQIPWNKGLTKSVDVRLKEVSKKVTRTLTGRKLTVEHRSNIQRAIQSSDAYRIAIANPERGKKISLAKQGKGNTKLTKEKVVEIRNSTLSQNKLAVRYGCSRSLIQSVQKRLVWKHI